jgi:type I restriction enzyme S subunit
MSNKKKLIGWKKYKLGVIGRVSMCKRIFKDQTTSNGDIPFYKIGTFGKEPDAYISENIYDEYSRKYPFPKVGEILISASGTIGRTVMYDGKPSYFQDSNIIWLANDEKIVLNSFLAYAYSLVNWVTESGTIARLYNDNFKVIEIVTPPLPEQHRIVAVLETWDKAIEKLTRKIELKKNIKKGLMQKLLTEKVRLPGFTEEWVTVELGGVCKITMGQSPASSSYNEEGNGLPLIQGNADIKNRKTIRRVWTTAPSKTSDEGDIILTVRAPVGVVGISQNEVCIGRGVCSIKVKGLNKDFVFYYLILIESNWKSYEQGSTFSAVNSSDVKGLNLFVPKSKAEQNAIARILTTADTEIEILEKKLSRLQEQKKYLLNNLVTGKIRTPENLKISHV